MLAVGDVLEEHEGADEREGPLREVVVGGEDGECGVFLFAVVDVVDHDLLLDGQFVEAVGLLVLHLLPADALHHAPHVLLGA